MSLQVDLSHIDATAFCSLPARLQEIAKRQPHRPAILFEDNEISWGQLARHARLIAGGLANLGLKPGERVAILSRNCGEYSEIFMGVVSGGYCAVTLPTMASAETLGVLLGDCRPAAIFISKEYEELAASVLQVANLKPALISISGGVFSCAELMAQSSENYQPPKIEPQREFNIVYSSGTTSTPKGIVHSHLTRAVMSKGLAGLNFDRSSITLISTPLYTNLSLPAFFATLWAGGAALIMPKFDAAQFLRLASSHRASHFFLVPVQVQRLLADPAFATTDLSATKLKYVAGSRFDPALKKAAIDKWPGILFEVYGMTEGAPLSSFVVNDHPEKIESVGRPAVGSVIKIIGEDGKELGVNTPGEIVGRSGAMMMGYNNRPDATKELIWSDVDGSIFFRSGDIGKLDEDGFLYVLDRKKDMIISGGLNIYASDIEAVIADHPIVAEVAVVAVPSKEWGESPFACVVANSGVPQVEAAELLQWINDRVAKYQRLAGLKYYDTLPRNALGKVLKKELRMEIVAKAGTVS